MIHMMCTIYQHWVYTPIQGINSASIRSPALRVSQGFFLTLFGQTWPQTLLAFDWNYQDFCLFMSPLFMIQTWRVPRVESRIIDSLPPSSYSRVLNKWTNQLLVTEKKIPPKFQTIFPLQIKKKIQHKNTFTNFEMYTREFRTLK